MSDCKYCHGTRKLMGPGLVLIKCHHCTWTCISK